MLATMEARMTTAEQITAQETETALNPALDTSKARETTVNTALAASEACVTALNANLKTSVTKFHILETAASEAQQNLQIAQDYLLPRTAQDPAEDLLTSVWATKRKVPADVVSAEQFTDLKPGDELICDVSVWWGIDGVSLSPGIFKCWKSLSAKSLFWSTKMRRRSQETVFLQSSRVVQRNLTAEGF